MFQSKPFCSILQDLVFSFRLRPDEVSSYQSQPRTLSTQGPNEEEPSPVPRPSPSPHPQNIQVTDMGVKQALHQVKINIFLASSSVNSLQVLQILFKASRGLFRQMRGLTQQSKIS